MTAQQVPASTRPRVTVRPVYARYHSEALAVDVARVVAWRAMCSCGFRSRTYKDRHDATEHSAEHRETHRA